MADLVRCSSRKRKSSVHFVFLRFRFANQLVSNVEHSTVSSLFEVLVWIISLLHSAVLNIIRHNSTCYPGIVCDGTEKSFYDCKYDPTQATAKNRDLSAYHYSMYR